MNLEKLSPRHLSKRMTAAMGRIMTREDHKNTLPTNLGFQETLEYLASQGYATISMGKGPWVSGKGARIVNEYAIGHDAFAGDTSEEIVALTFYKFESPNGYTMHSGMQVSYYPDSHEYDLRAREWQLSFGAQELLVDYIQEMSGSTTAV